MPAGGEKMKAKVKQPLYDAFHLRGQLEYVLRDARTGAVVRRGKKHNTVTFGGRGWVLAKLTPSSNTNLFTSLAIGATSTAPTSSDTNLASYQTIRNFGANTTLTTSTNAACTWSGAVSFNSNETWTNSTSVGEFAIFNATTNASFTMFNRLNTNPVINFASTNTLAITVTITN